MELVNTSHEELARAQGGIFPICHWRIFFSSLIQQVEVCFVQIKLNPQHISDLGDYKY